MTVYGLTTKQKMVLRKLALRDYPVTPPTLNCSESVLFKLHDGGLVRIAVGGVGNLGRRAWEITNNGRVLMSMLEPKTFNPVTNTGEK